ncbi:hypothetical protein B0T25DRAFT_16162 [Lasiosphaeria hispida]|uniref:Transmembrane protein n=1 Tax=Lasiosphaeria hispida TaxID=260671 RepID=A0AAJ0HU83_9PEZI|nr:hypothetical protein B0T25DRAFT_16162 [Lasiosphaeria hispida]
MDKLVVGAWAWGFRMMLATPTVSWFLNLANFSHSGPASTAVIAGRALLMASLTRIHCILDEGGDWDHRQHKKGGKKKEQRGEKLFWIFIQGVPKPQGWYCIDWRRHFSARCIFAGWWLVLVVVIFVCFGPSVRPSPAS